MSDGDMNIAAADVPHNIRIIFFVILGAALLIGAYVMFVDQRASIPEELQEDIILEHMQTCLAPTIDGINMVGEISSLKLSSIYLEGCLPEKITFGAVGVRIQHLDSGESEVVTLNEQPFATSTTGRLATLRHSNGFKEPIIFEVLLR